MSNQSHVPVHELVYEKQRWAVISHILASLCAKNNINFVDRGHLVYRCPTSDRVLYSHLFDNFSLQTFDLISRRYQSLGQKVYFLVDSWIDSALYDRPYAKVFSRPQLFSLTALSDSPVEPSDEFRLFNCFIHRTEAVRQSWFYFLYLRGLLDKGYVSYLLFQLNTNATGLELFDQIHRDHLDQVPHFQTAHAHLRQHVPYCNFTNRDNLLSLINSTKYSLVLDTYAPDDDVGSFYISEKVTRALQSPTINLLFLQKGTICRLHESGLAVDRALLDIDDLTWIERQQKLLRILEDDGLTPTKTKVKDDANHNRHVLNDWVRQCLHRDFYTDIFDIISTD